MNNKLSQKIKVKQILFVLIFNYKLVIFLRSFLLTWIQTQKIFVIKQGLG